MKNNYEANGDISMIEICERGVLFIDTGAFVAFNGNFFFGFFFNKYFCKEKYANIVSIQLDKLDLDKNELFRAWYCEYMNSIGVHRYYFSEFWNKAYAVSLVIFVRENCSPLDYDSKLEFDNFIYMCKTYAPAFSQSRRAPKMKVSFFKTKLKIVMAYRTFEIFYKNNICIITNTHTGISKDFYLK